MSGEWPVFQDGIATTVWNAAVDGRSGFGFLAALIQVSADPFGLAFWSLAASFVCLSLVAGNGSNQFNYVLGNMLAVLAFSTCMVLLMVRTVVLHNPAQDPGGKHMYCSSNTVANTTRARLLVGLLKIMGCGCSWSHSSRANVYRCPILFLEKWTHIILETRGGAFSVDVELLDIYTDYSSGLLYFLWSFNPRAYIVKAF